MCSSDLGAAGRLNREGPSSEGARSSPAPFAWDEVMAFGFGVLRRSSCELWAMTPRELAAARAAIFGPPRAAPARGTLTALMREFPDEE